MKARWVSIPAAALMMIGSGEALADEALAKRNACFECHSTNKKVVGPAFQDIAARYRNDARARAALIEKVKKGGKGNWTDITGGAPMAPYQGRLSVAEIERLVDWVLGH